MHLRSSPVFIPLVVCTVAVTALATTTTEREVQRWECKQDVDDGMSLIWQYDVRRPPRSGGYQEVEAEYGPTDVRITDVIFNALLDHDNSSCWVASGGIGRNYIKLKFRSEKSRGLHYRVCLYGLRLSDSTRQPPARLG